MTLVLDAGALIAIERNDRAMWRRLKSALNSGEVPITHGGVVGQAWRGRGSRSALIALALDSIDVEALDEDLGRRSGELLGRVRKNDPGISTLTRRAFAPLMARRPLPVGEAGSGVRIILDRSGHRPPPHSLVRCASTGQFALHLLSIV